MIKRRVRTLLLFPGAQLKHGFMFLGVSTLIHLLLTGASILAVDAWLAGRTGIGEQPLWRVLAAIALVYGFFLYVIFVFGLFLSHRWIGPWVSIEKFVAALARGERGQKLVLRDYDMAHFKKIADSLNQVAERLDKEKTPR